MRIRPLTIALSLVVTLVAAPVLATGCETSVTSGGTTSYSNDEYGFSFEIDDRFEEGDDPALSQVSGNAAFTIGFGDPDGTKDASGTVLDVFLVSVYELTQPVTDDLMPAMKAELETAMEQLTAGDTGVSMGPLTETTVNGLPGFVTDGTMDVDGIPVQTRVYFLVDGATEFQLTLQSAQDAWEENEPELQKAADSFKVE